MNSAQVDASPEDSLPHSTSSQQGAPQKNSLLQAGLAAIKTRSGLKTTSASTNIGETIKTSLNAVKQRFDDLKDFAKTRAKTVGKTIIDDHIDFGKIILNGIHKITDQIKTAIENISNSLHNIEFATVGGDARYLKESNIQQIKKDIDTNLNVNISGKGTENNISKLTDTDGTTVSKVIKGAANHKLVANKFPDEALPLNGQRRVDFVIDSNGNLNIGNKHRFLGNAQDVKAAGQLKLDGQGRIRRIDNLSGHYRPTVDEAMNYPELFTKIGLNIKYAWLELYELKVDADGLVENYVKAVSKKIK